MPATLLRSADFAPAATIVVTFASRFARGWRPWTSGGRNVDDLAIARPVFQPRLAARPSRTVPPEPSVATTALVSPAVGEGMADNSPKPQRSRNTRRDRRFELYYRHVLGAHILARGQPVVRAKRVGGQQYEPWSATTTCRPVAPIRGKKCGVE